MNHKDKVKLARKIRTKRELKLHTSIFQTTAWETRAKKIQKEVARKIAHRQLASKLRKERLAAAKI